MLDNFHLHDVYRMRYVWLKVSVTLAYLMSLQLEKH